jgi:hypothetical protein
MVPDYDDLFARRAEKYDRFVAAEDFQGNLLRTVMQLSQLDLRAGRHGSRNGHRQGGLSDRSSRPPCIRY